MNLITSGKLYRVMAPSFVAGIVVAQDGVIIDAAPILRRYGNWAFAGFCAMARRRGWTVEPI